MYKIYSFYHKPSMLTDLMRSDQLRSEWSLPSTCLLAFLIGKNRFILIFLWFHVWFVCRYAMKTHLSSGIHYVTLSKFRVFGICPIEFIHFIAPAGSYMICFYSYRKEKGYNKFVLLRIHIQF